MVGEELKRRYSVHISSSAYSPQSRGLQCGYPTVGNVLYWPQGAPIPQYIYQNWLNHKGQIWLHASELQKGEILLQILLGYLHMHTRKYSSWTALYVCMYLEVRNGFSLIQEFRQDRLLLARWCCLAHIERVALTLPLTAVSRSIVLLHVEQLVQQGWRNCHSECPPPCQGRGCGAISLRCVRGWGQCWAMVLIQ
jgi:hypothetical protein